MKIINTLKKSLIILTCMLLIDFCLLIFSTFYYLIKYKFYSHPIGIVFIIGIIGTICLSFISNKRRNKYNLKIKFFLELFLYNSIGLLFVFGLMTILALYELYNTWVLLIESIILCILLIILMILIVRFKEEN